MHYRTSESEAAFFEENGYLILPQQIFAPEKYERLKAHADQLFADRATPDGHQPPLVDCPHWTDPAMFEWIMAPEMLDLVEPIIGPNIGIFACHFLQKPPGVGMRVPWHEDSAYWKKILEPMVVASVTVAFTPSSSENGCLRVIPGSHRHGYSDYGEVSNPSEQVFPIEILKEQMDESKAVDITLQPNQASIHDGRIIHGSSPNTSGQGRSCLTVRYFPTSTKFNRDEWFHGNFHVFLARGENLAGNDFSDPGGNHEMLTGGTTA